MASDLQEYIEIINSPRLFKTKSGTIFFIKVLPADYPVLLGTRTFRGSPIAIFSVCFLIMAEHGHYKCEKTQHM